MTGSRRSCRGSPSGTPTRFLPVKGVDRSRGGGAGKRRPGGLAASRRVGDCGAKVGGYPASPSAKSTAASMARRILEPWRCDVSGVGGQNITSRSETHSLIITTHVVVLVGSVAFDRFSVPHFPSPNISFIARGRMLYAICFLSFLSIKSGRALINST